MKDGWSVEVRRGQGEGKKCLGEVKGRWRGHMEHKWGNGKMKETLGCVKGKIDLLGGARGGARGRLRGQVRRESTEWTSKTWVG